MAVAALLLLLAATFCAAQPSYAACSGCGGSRGDRLCGPKSLLLVCAQLGVAADLDELTKLAETDDSGATMAGLAKAARHKGLQAVGLKIGLSELAHCQEPAICHLWGDHFVVAQSDGAGVISVTDPSAGEGEQKVPFDDFKAAYSGFALLLSRQAIAPPGLHAAAPDLRLNTYWYDLGTLDEGAKVGLTITFRNAGEQELTISRVRQTCTCIGVGQVTRSIPPGGSGSISFTYDASGLRGAQAQALYIESNDPVSPLVQVQVGALVRPGTLLVSTRRVDLGTVDSEKGAARELYVKDPGDGSLDIRDVTSDSQLLDVALAGTAPPGAKELVFPLRVSLKPGAPVGPFMGSITIVSNHAKEPRLTIPVTARIKGDVEVRPETLFLGFIQKGRPASESIALLAASARGFSITDVRMSSDLFTAKALPADTGRGCKVIVGLTEAAPAGLVKVYLIIRTDSSLQPTITVPVSAYVEDRERMVSREPANEPEQGPRTPPPDSEGTLAPAPSGQARNDAKGAIVRVYVFTSQGCHDCTLVDNEHLQAIAARVGCRVEAKHFDVADTTNWRKLTDLERNRHDSNNAIPVVFVGTEVIGGEQEVGEMLEPIVAMYAAEGGTSWPDEMESGSQGRD